MLLICPHGFRRHTSTLLLRYKMSAIGFGMIWLCIPGLGGLFPSFVLISKWISVYANISLISLIAKNRPGLY